MNIKKAASLLALSKVLPSKTIENGLTKLSPQLGKFFNNASKSGYGAGAVIGFLKSNLFGDKTTEQAGERPDEMANREMARQRNLPENILKTAGNIGGGALTGGLSGALLGRGAGMAGSAAAAVLQGGGEEAPQQQPQQEQMQPEMQQEQPQPEMQQEQMQPEQPQQEQMQPEQPQQGEGIGLLTTLEKIAKVDSKLSKAISDLFNTGLPNSKILEFLKRNKPLTSNINKTQLKLKMTLKEMLSSIREDRNYVDETSGTQQESGKGEYLSLMRDIEGRVRL